MPTRQLVIWPTRAKYVTLNATGQRHAAAIYMAHDGISLAYGVMSDELAIIISGNMPESDAAAVILLMSLPPDSAFSEWLLACATHVAHD